MAVDPGVPRGRGEDVANKGVAYIGVAFGCESEQCSHAQSKRR